jgi:hypothetical protein
LRADLRNSSRFKCVAHPESVRNPFLSSRNLSQLTASLRIWAEIRRGLNSKKEGIFPMQNSVKSLLLAAAVSGLMAGTTPVFAAAAPAGTSPALQAGVPALSGNMLAHIQKHSCKGKNNCKGQGGCKSSDNGCKGKNSCKGKGGCATNGHKMPQ